MYSLSFGYQGRYTLSMLSGFLFLMIFTFVGCGGHNPSSSRGTSRLLVGTWIVPETEMQFLSINDRTHVIFNPNDSFTAPIGIGVELMRNYEGQYWQEGNFIGTRGLGERMGPGGVWRGEIIVKFAKVEMTDFDLRLMLTIQEVKDLFITERRDLDELSGLTSSRIKAILKWLNKQNLSPVAFEGSRSYVKIEEISN